MNHTQNLPSHFSFLAVLFLLGCGPMEPDSVATPTISPDAGSAKLDAGADVPSPWSPPFQRSDYIEASRPVLAQGCLNDEQCQDNLMCNGKEKCEAGSCVAGAPMRCDDGSPCTMDSCEEFIGCQNQLIDADHDGTASDTLGACGTDCDDTDRNVHVGAYEACDNKDNDCDGDIDEDTSIINWYPDCDGDGYAASAASTTASCNRPTLAATGCPDLSISQWTTNAPIDLQSTDCNDSSAVAYPGQSNYQPDPIQGTSDFDYNCDGLEEQRYSMGVAECIITGPQNEICRANGTGWLDSMPMCGMDGSMVVACEGRTDQGVRCDITTPDCKCVPGFVLNPVRQSCR